MKLNPTLLIMAIRLNNFRMVYPSTPLRMTTTPLRITKYIISFLVFFVSVSGNGQETSNTFSAFDSVYAAAVRLKFEGANDKAYSMLCKAEKQAEVQKDYYWQSRLLIERGKTHYNLGEYDLSLKYFLEALTLATDNGSDAVRSEALNYIGKYYHSTGDFEKSYKYYLKSLKLAEQIKDTVQMAFVCNNIGNHFADYGEHSSSFEYYLKAYNLQKSKILDKAVFASSCNNLGKFYREIDDYEASLPFYFEALHNRQSINYIEGEGKSYYNISKVYFDMGAVDSSELYAEKALDLLTQVGYAKGIIKCYNQLGDICLLKNELDKAQGFYMQSYLKAVQIKYDKGILYANIPLARILFLKKRLHQSLIAYEQCLTMALNQNKKEEIRDCYKGIQLVHEAMGNYRQANIAANEYIRYSEEISKDEYSKQIASLNVAFNTERKEKMNELLRSENQLKTLRLKQNSLILLLVFICLFFVSVMAVVAANRNKKKRIANEKLKELNDELIGANREKDKFFSIISHELRNPLWWFKNITEMLTKNFSKMSEDDLSQSLRTMDESAKNTFLLMDNLLNWSRSQIGVIPFNPARINIKELVDQNLLLFDLMIQHKNIDVEMHFPKEYFCFVDSNLINTVFRNILSNAVKFTPQNGHISICAFEEDRALKMVFNDNGIGIDSSVIKALFDDRKTYSTLGVMQEKGSGLGLKLCKEFITLNKGHIEINSEKEKGTTVNVWLPLEKSNADETQVEYAERLQRTLS